MIKLDLWLVPYLKVVSFCIPMTKWYLIGKAWWITLEVDVHYLLVLDSQISYFSE